MLALSALTTLFATLASAAPLSKRAANSTIGSSEDVTILQYALTLENLESAFYSEALAKFDTSSFTEAGSTAWARGRLVQVSEHEAAHVAFLESAIKAAGSTPTSPCNYTFPYTDVESFLDLAHYIEQVGVSAYLGALNKITSVDYIRSAATITTVEGRHQTWLAAAILKGAPWSGPNDTPLDFSQVYNLVTPYITSCPSSNPALPVTAFPNATIEGSSIKAGEKVMINYTVGNSTEQNFVIYSGVDFSIQPISNNSVTLPSGLVGIAYGVVTDAAQGNVTANDNNTLSGPIILDFGLASNAVATDA